MSLKDIELEDSLSRINLLENILSLTLLKDHLPDENIEEIDEILGSIRSRLYGATQSGSSNSQLDSSEELKIIKKKLITSNKKDDEKKFDFQIKTFSMESVLDDLNKCNYKLADYIESFGTTNICYLNKAWIDGTPEYKEENTRQKYVKLDDKDTSRVGFAVANSFTYGIQTEIKKCLSYIDTEKKIINWEAVMQDLKSLAKSSGYTEGDVRLALMGLIRLGGLNQDLYSHMNINEIADCLIKSVKPIHKSTLLWGALRKLTREINTPLQLILAEAESYIRKIFPEPNQHKVRENYHFVALTSFINDKLSLEVVNDIKRKKELNQEYNYEHYKDMLIRLEQNEINIPTEILKYGRNTKQQNSIQEETLYNATLYNIQNKTDSYDSIHHEENKDCSYLFANDNCKYYNTYYRTDDRSQCLDRSELRSEPKQNTYNRDGYVEDHTLGDSRPDDRYNSYHGNNYKEENRSRYTKRRMSPDFTSRRNIPESETNKYRTMDGHYTGYFPRSHSSEIREDYPRFRPGRNCREDYNPYKYKFCRKCNPERHYGHHEFNCKYFESYNDSNCKKCHNGFHFEQNCDLECDYKKNGQLG